MLIWLQSDFSEQCRPSKQSDFEQRLSYILFHVSIFRNVMGKGMSYHSDREYVYSAVVYQKYLNEVERIDNFRALALNRVRYF